MGGFFIIYEQVNGNTPSVSPAFSIGCLEQLRDARPPRPSFTVSKLTVEPSVGSLPTQPLHNKKATIMVAVHFILERVMGIEPTLLAWKAKVLPLNYTRK